MGILPLHPQEGSIGPPLTVSICESQDAALVRDILILEDAIYKESEVSGDPEKKTYSTKKNRNSVFRLEKM